MENNDKNISIIERIDNRMAMTCMADFVLLGHQQAGSFALSSDKTKLFAVAIGTYMDIICDTFNIQAIPRLIDLNKNHFTGLENYPKLVHGGIEKPNLKEFAEFLKIMVGIDVLTSDKPLEDFVRRAKNLPEAEEGTEYPIRMRKNHDNTL